MSDRILTFFLNCFATERRLLAVTLIYLISIVAGRLIADGALGRDDVEAALLAQGWGIGYRADQPPLHTWLLAAYQQVLGDGLLAHTILRFDLLGASYLFSYLAGREAGLTTRNAGLAAATPSLSIVFGWQALDLYTHSMVLAAILPLCLFCVLRVRRTESWRDHFWLGLAFGLLLLSKYSAILLIAGFCIAAASMRSWRHLLTCRRFALTLIIAVTLAAPYGIWLSDQAEGFVAGAQESLALGGGGLEITFRPDGLIAAGGALINIVGIPALALLLIVPGIVRRPPVGFDGPVGDARRMIERTVVATLALYCVGIVLFGAGGLSAHHLISPLLWLPIAAFLRIQARGADLDRRLKWYAGALVGCAAVAVLAFSVKVFSEISVTNCDRCYLTRPYAAIAEAISDSGFTGGTVVASNQLLGGGLVPFMPDRTVVVTNGYPDPRRPRSTQTADQSDQPDVESRLRCLLVWESGDSVDDDRHRANQLRAQAELRYGITLPPAEIIQIEAPYLYAASSPRRFMVSMVSYPATGGCR